MIILCGLNFGCGLRTKTCCAILIPYLTSERNTCNDDERTSTAGLHLLRHMLRTILAIALASSVCAKTHSGTKR